MWNRILDLAAANPNLTAGAFAFAAAVFSGLISLVLKRPIVKQTLAVDNFKATLAGYETLNRGLTARVEYLQNLHESRNSFEEELRQKIRELDPEQVERRWRHLANNLITVIVGLRDRLRRMGYPAEISGSAFRQFIEDGGEIPGHWYDALEFMPPSATDVLDILLVEDNEQLGRRWCYDLETRGYVITRVAGADAALRVEQQPRLAIIDIMLEKDGMDGSDLARAFRDRGYTCPMLAITGGADQAKLDRELFMEVLQKPIRFDLLLETVQRYLGEK